MKYTQMLDQNMVPEWRDQYLDYNGLDSMLQKAIENKNIKSRRKGVDSYFELIKFNQKFASYFHRKCQVQLDKIDAFHKEKLNEMRGKFNNLQDQLDQILSSAIFRQVQPDFISAPKENYHSSENSLSLSDSDRYATINSITDMFKTFKEKIGMNPTDLPQQRSVSPRPSKTIFIRGDNNSSNSDDSSREEGNQTNQLEQLFKRQRLLSTSNTFNQFQLASKRRVSLLRDKITHSLQNSARRLSIVPNMENGLQSRFNHFRGSVTSRILLETSNNNNNNNNKINSNINNLKINNPIETASSQSKKKILSSYKKKIGQLKFAFKELYFNLVLFEQYTQLNYAGFEQILRKHDRMFASTLGRKFYQEYIQTADFYTNLQAIDHLVESVEHVYTLHFVNGNRRKAIEKLQVPSSVYRQSSPMLDFRTGYELGMFAVLFILVITVGLVRDTGFDWRTVFRLYRSPLLLIIFLFQAGISIVIWKHYKINHVLIFELNPRNNLSFQHFIEFGSILGILWSISVLLFLFSERLSIKPSLCPLVVILVIIIYLFNPTATCHYKARFWLLKILGRIVTAPLYPVKFADFWIADQLVSIVPFFLDLEFLSCFYSTGDLSNVKLTKEYTSRCVTRNEWDLFVRTIVATLPAWFRFAQCLRRWRDENWLRLHLANAAKYLCMILVVILSSISQYKKSSFELFDTMRIIWMIAAIFTSSLTAWWDIIYDFGLFNTYDKKDSDDRETKSRDSFESSSSRSSSLSSPSSLGDDGSDDLNTAAEEYGSDSFEKKERKRNYPFLRKELVYPVWVYYFAIVEDCILRFGWIITMSLTEFSGIEAGLCVSLLAPMEMFRRFVWNCIRLENEQLNNCGLFRAVRDIPLVVVAPIDESQLDKVIMMMDSRDGPSMRNRLMKRRTLRPDRVSFMLLQRPDSDKPFSPTGLERGRI